VSQTINPTLSVPAVVSNGLAIASGKDQETP